MAVHSQRLVNQMPPFEQNPGPVEKPHTAGQKDQSSHPLLDDYLKSVPAIAKKFESGPISSDGAKADLSLTLTNIYKEAGGGDSGKQAEAAFQNKLNDQFKTDKSSLHLDTTSLFGKKGYFALVNDADNTSSGLIKPEIGDPKADATTGQGTAADNAGADKTPEPFRTMDANTSESQKPADAALKSADSAPNNAPDISKASEQLYNRSAEDAVLAMTNKNLNSDQRAASVVDAMNKAGVKSNTDVEHFEEALRSKLGKNANVTPIAHGTGMFSSELMGRFDVNTGRGNNISVIYKMDNGKLQAPQPEK